VITGDIDGNSTVNWADLAALTNNWLVDNCTDPNWCDGTDLNQDGDVNLADFALLGQNWGVIEPYIITLLASYEDGEFYGGKLVIGSTAYGGTCTVTNPLASSEGLTATDGDYILKLDIVNAGKPDWAGDEARGKVEISHTWSEMTFDVGGAVTEILYDIYFAPGTTSMSVTGLWDSEWLPNTWFSGGTVDTTSGTWHTITIDVPSVTPITTDDIAAMVFEGLRPIVPAGTGTFTGVIYVDNLRSQGPNPDYVIPAPDGGVAGGHEKRIDIVWQPVDAPGFLGYNIYRSSSASGPFTKLNSSLYELTVYSDFLNANDQTYHYYVTSVGGSESSASTVVSATSYAMTDDELLESVQQATFRYFWDYAHPVSGLARSGLDNNNDTCDSGGTGMGMMAICVGAERGFVSRAEAAERVLKILTFLDEKAERFHGAWSHILHGVTGEAIPFSEYDDGGDIVETSYAAQGMLTVRQYFDDTNDATETAVRNLATQLWEEIEWDWYLRRSDTGYENNEKLFWHWSPNYGWAMNHNVLGYDECMITYLMAIASPTHPIPASCYYHGWASKPDYANGRTIYGYALPVGSNYSGYGGPMFFAHYTYLGFDPNWSDAYCNYSYNNRQIALSDRAYCAANPGGYTGYSDLVWGLTASFNPYQGYRAHCPVEEDDGTIAPTAAISSIIYTPDESIATLKHFYHTYGAAGLWGPFGFVDAFNLNYPDWYANSYITIDQGPIVVMIENYRSGLCWDLFMANSEVTAMMAAIAATEPTPVIFDDFDGNNINNGWFGSGGTASWTISTSNTEQVHGGTYALKAVYNKGTEPLIYLGSMVSAGSRNFSDYIMLKTWIYPSKSTDYIVKIEWPGGAVERRYSVTANTWQEVILTFGDSANDMTNVTQFLVFPEAVIGGGSGTFWLDDIVLQ
jgi:hypothetical protein